MSNTVALAFSSPSAFRDYWKGNQALTVCPGQDLIVYQTEHLNDKTIFSFPDPLRRAIYIIDQMLALDGLSSRVKGTSDTEICALGSSFLFSSTGSVQISVGIKHLILSIGNLFAEMLLAKQYAVEIRPGQLLILADLQATPNHVEEVSAYLQTHTPKGWNCYLPPLDLHNKVLGYNGIQDLFVTLNHGRGYEIRLNRHYTNVIEFQNDLLTGDIVLPVGASLKVSGEIVKQANAAYEKSFRSSQKHQFILDYLVATLGKSIDIDSKEGLFAVKITDDSISIMSRPYPICLKLETNTIPVDLKAMAQRMLTEKKTQLDLEAGQSVCFYNIPNCEMFVSSDESLGSNSYSKAIATLLDLSMPIGFSLNLDLGMTRSYLQKDPEGDLSLTTLLFTLDGKGKISLVPAKWPDSFLLCLKILKNSYSRDSGRRYGRLRTLPLSGYLLLPIESTKTLGDPSVSHLLSRKNSKSNRRFAKQPKFPGEL